LTKESEMTMLTTAELPLSMVAPADRLRRIATAVRVHFTWWGVHRTLTAQQKEEVGDACGADARLLTASKKIIDVRHPTVRRLTSIRSRVVHYWRGLTLPYVEAGVRLIRQADVEPFAHNMEGFREEMVRAEADVDAVYNALKADARERLGRLYNPADYPPAVRGLFRVACDFPSVEPPAYLMRLSPEVYRQEQERVSRRFEEAVRLAEQAFVAEFARLVSHLAERLGGGADGERRVFRDSVVGNLREFFSRFRELNVGSNEDLERLVERAQDLVQGVGPQDLRDDVSLRRHVAAEMAVVQSQLESMTVERPRRRIVRPAAWAFRQSCSPTVTARRPSRRPRAGVD
jgi:hypothetical protein